MSAAVTRRILFVCTANICRSPMAQALFNAQAAKRNEAGAWSARSAGTWAAENQAASGHAVTVMAQRGLKIQSHRAHQVDGTSMEEADVVVVMTRNHRDALMSEFPAQRKKIHLMSELEGREYDIADPYGGTLDEYEIRAREFEQLIERGYERIKEWVPE